MSLTPFVHLHVHSQFSVLDGQASITNLVNKAKEDGMPGIALTDHGTMYGVKEFLNYTDKVNGPHLATIRDCQRELNELSDKENGNEVGRDRIEKLQSKIEREREKLFKPIVGCECYVARRTRKDKDKDVPDPYHPTRSVDASGWHLILLAKNKVGYHNLIKIVSASSIEGFYHRPRIDRELLERYHEGIVCTSACLGGEVSQHILAGNLNEAEKTILWYKELFADDYYLEVQRHETNNPLANRETFHTQQRVNRIILELAEKCGVKVVATNDVHFVNEEDGEAHDRLICLSTGRDLDDPNRMRYTKQEWLKTTAEMNAVFEDYPETLSNTIEVFDKVEYYSINNKPMMPHFPIPEEFADNDEYLRHLTYEGARKKYGSDLSDEVKERIDFELSVIKGMGFPGYFLIVQDFIAAARGMGVAVGPGRGSAAGSAVAYSLGITDIDPIKYDLLFERFLNPDRISMPDIDIDFDDDGRAEVLRWVTEKYGKDRVAHIVTYGSMLAKSALRDVARVEKLTIDEGNRLSKLVPEKIPNEKKVTLAKAVEVVPELKLASLSERKALSDTIKYAVKLDGNVRNVGVHACGIIIGKTDISDVVPVSLVKDGDEDLLVTQYEGSVIEDVGLIKMDFLGLKTLSVIKEAIDNIKRTRGIDLNIDEIPLDDAKTYELYCEGHTLGTFQFESAGMQKYLRELKPTVFEDLIAMNALYRPGPMEYIPSFIARKNGGEEIVYDLPVMERYLKDTYGITVYQEQVMLLSRELAGFTRGESDELRKAMGKKLIDKMEALKVKFLEGGKAKEYDEKILLKIWNDWTKFAQYAFNKSHATCYSRVAYETAYLKANYPSEYMAGALSRNLNNISEITKLMDECRRMKIAVLVPDVNESDKKFFVNQRGDIRFGLSAIKGVSSAAVENIIEERAKNGPYKDIYDFVERIDTSACNKRTMESLAMSGAFDSFTLTREQYMAPSGRDESFLSTLIRYGSIYKEDKLQASNSLFGDDVAMDIPRPEVPEAEPWSTLDILNKERELVGLYLSANPMAPYSVILDHYCTAKMEQLRDLESLRDRNVMMAGVVSSVRKGMTKKNTPYAIISLEDFTGTSELPLFGENFVKFSGYAIEGLYLFVRGTVRSKPWNESDLEVFIRSIELLNDVADTLVKKLTIQLPIGLLTKDLIEALSEEIDKKQGSAQLMFQVMSEQRPFSQEFSRRGTIAVTPSLVNCLKENGLPFRVE